MLKNISFSKHWNCSIPKKEGRLMCLNQSYVIVDCSLILNFSSFLVAGGILKKKERVVIWIDR